MVLGTKELVKGEKAEGALGVQQTPDAAHLQQHDEHPQPEVDVACSLGGQDGRWNAALAKSHHQYTLAFHDEVRDRAVECRDQKAE